MGAAPHDCNGLSGQHELAEIDGCDGMQAGEGTIKIAQSAGVRPLAAPVRS